MSEKVSIAPNDSPSGGWGSVKEVASILLQENVALSGPGLLVRQNKPDGFACVSCSWAKPANPHPFEFCESGAKATAWEVTSKRVDANFFHRHTVTALESWSDHDLEEAGRLTVPLRWDAQSDCYVEVSWQAAFDEIGAELRRMLPKDVVFYSSGRASLEASYLYQLLARVYGCNNLPDSSNMCHESTSVGLKKAIGVGVGTVVLDDFDKTDCLFFFGQNVGINSPRMLHQLQDARKRGVPIITFNPLRERGLVSFVNPQSPAEMLSGAETAISTQYHQVKAGGDTAVLLGLCKAVLAADDKAAASGAVPIIDRAFIAQHTSGFDEFAAAVRGCSWSDIESKSGLTRMNIESAADAYCRAKAVIGVYGMGLTQHRGGVLNVQMLSNLLLLRGNIGKPGAGICPVRGHSNVQGQRTVGITEKPELAPLDKLKELYGFEPPRKKGLATVDACEGILDGSVKAFFGLGGNFVRAIPDTDRMEAAWRKLPLTVQVATKLNRSHLIHGEVAYLLPCLGRIEIDRQATGPQIVSMEDSTGHMHASHAVAEPAAATLMSEVAIVAGIAKATLSDNKKVKWDDWVGDYSKIRDEIAKAYPEIFHDFNARFEVPGGFPRPVAARDRVWKTETKKANFIVPYSLVADPDAPSDGEGAGKDVLRLITLRSDDQFNTTIYSLDDRFRRVKGTRKVLLMNGADMARLGLAEGSTVTASTAVEDGITRHVKNLVVRRYAIPRGSAGGYYPELNPLIPLWHHAKESKVPAAKSIPIRLTLQVGDPTDPAAA